MRWPKALSQGFLLAFLLRPTRLAGLSEELALGVVGGWTAYTEPEDLVAVIAAFLDYQKNFDAALRLRLGPPIIEIPGGVMKVRPFSCASEQRICNRISGLPRRWT